MSTDAASRGEPFGRLEQLRFAREVLRHEGKALVTLAERLDGAFCRAIEILSGCTGSVIVSGMGKAGLVGQKIAATLASTGTRAHFLHPAEAVHGDLGRVHRDDVVLVLSQSGETEEIVSLLTPLARLGVPLIAITGRPESTLGAAAAVTLDLGRLEEACWLGLAPSTSTTAMMSLGDALALVTSRLRGFAEEDFARFHPGGSLGRKLSRVEDIMRSIDECRVTTETKSVREVFVEVSRPGRRTGAIMLTDAEGVLTGVFTDSDLARLFEGRRDGALDGPVRDVMTTSPATVVSGTLLPRAVDLLASRRISELPVVDELGRPLGMLDITDVLAVLPTDPAAENRTAQPPPLPKAEAAAATPTEKLPAQSTPRTLPFVSRTD